ncbi:MAG TPA: repressor LexA [Alphaproteobacteria bacterium]|nr:repressor LexA [Paracoccaceae bacterium]RCL81247.1 MAG: transcriptional repressor LexA [SAR116 cluster bacterium]RPH14366.1 MAG: transcriptional repressor LexA [Alphaproteobacteria bacterium TMED150]HBQ22292.1 repressor LexA [Alphaproteobacteria bacterium]HCJ62321.1 repressor LexA [Alphaproteobacteria bacterium]|tara:strand:+ start:682 stop:1332 length:651 start_codon:yes stop_codon:yes gene_type:complete
MLTEKQQNLLTYIEAFLAEQGRPPSFEQMMAAMGLKSKSNIHRLIGALEERGYIKRLPNKARALEVLKSSIPQNPGAANLHMAETSEVVPLPLVGRIAAGFPAEAIANPERHVSIPLELLPDSGNNSFVLEVTGDSMIDAGIFDGDYAVIKEDSEPRNGDIVVALIDMAETTLKRLRRRGQSIALEPANDMFETRIYGPGRVTIQGKLVALIRRYQ